MKLLFINESIFELYKSLVERGEPSFIHVCVCVCVCVCTRFSDPDRSLNCKREMFKVFKVEPRLNRDRTVMMS